MSRWVSPAAARMKVFAGERVNQRDMAAPDRERAGLNRTGWRTKTIWRIPGLRHDLDSPTRPNSFPLTSRPSPSRPSPVAYSSVTSPSATGAGLLMPSTPLTFSSISAMMAGLSFRNIFAFSRPCPIRCVL